MQHFLEKYVQREGRKGTDWLQAFACRSSDAQERYTRKPPDLSPQQGHSQIHQARQKGMNLRKRPPHTSRAPRDKKNDTLPLLTSMFMAWHWARQSVVLLLSESGLTVSGQLQIKCTSSCVKLRWFNEYIILLNIMLQRAPDHFQPRGDALGART